ncbi:alpha/beta-hydrolase [Gloeophyllum trabeum ATCC 11539]|uniref:Alpha/beta-hydrolase n=1 Tax=Gloeophyllum trabeum (strain ATCC 11539 / FP-39264 / Madison 617) TaxID=670483 RepID=S7RPN7_GLOTA|nr:alpha/beta-hydrolase [Gloeophyllum trabeum ATCC 11539]EPQ54849.1 alpha/beta-hydrolase [Gloeophyllum trabeum ATCC 11539]
MRVQTYFTKLLQVFSPLPVNFSREYEHADKQQLSRSYSISGTLCTPKDVQLKDVEHVQYLIHGVGFDSSYWDFAVPGKDEYSYVSAAADAGYTTFRYDRLGTGLSEHPSDTYNEVQAPTDLAIATKLLSMLKDGQIGGQKFSKVVGVGHSYGSEQVQALSATVPHLLDGILLQGFSMNAYVTGGKQLLTSGAYSTASQVFPERFKDADLASTYFVTLAPQTQQLNFWYFPFYSDAAFQRNRETEQPVTQGVLFTQGVLMQNATQFTGPVHVVTGAEDWPFCFLDCYAVPANSTRKSIPEYVQELYPAVSDFSVYIPENTGHAVNAHYSAPQVYQEMLGFVRKVLSG